MSPSPTTLSLRCPRKRATVVQKMRSIIEDNDLHVMATVARYVCSFVPQSLPFPSSPLTLLSPPPPRFRYAKIAKPSWWMKSRDCGPVVEQATHFIDLSRYFGGDVDLSSVQAHALGASSARASPSARLNLTVLLGFAFVP
jgi:hypothetical protein